MISFKIGIREHRWNIRIAALAPAFARLPAPSDVTRCGRIAVTALLFAVIAIWIVSSGEAQSLNGFEQPIHSPEANEPTKGWSDWVSEGKALNSEGKYPAAVEAFRRALAAAEFTNAGEHKLAGIYDALGSAYANAGQYAAAEHEYRRGLALVEKTRGRQSIDYAILLSSLAVLPTQIGNRDDVVELLREAITFNVQTASARELAIVRGCLAQLLMDGKRYLEAEFLLLDALADAASLKTTNPKLLAQLLTGLGQIRFGQGRYAESVDLYQESAQLFASVASEESASLIVPNNDLALSYLKLGRLNEAEQTLRNAIALCDKTLGQDHPTCGAVLENYAVVLWKLGRKREAKTLAARSRQITRASRRQNGVGSTISVTALRY